jgi:hypothetical protein
MKTEQEKWDREDLSSVFFTLIAKRLEMIALRGADDLDKVHGIYFNGYRSQLKSICRYFYEVGGKDFEAFLDTLAEVLVRENWKNNGIEEFTDEFSRLLPVFANSGRKKRNRQARMAKQSPLWGSGELDPPRCASRTQSLGW